MARTHTHTHTHTHARARARAAGGALRCSSVMPPSSLTQRRPTCSRRKWISSSMLVNLRARRVRCVQGDSGVMVAMAVVVTRTCGVLCDVTRGGRVHGMRVQTEHAHAAHWLNTMALAPGSLRRMTSSSSRSASILVLLWKRDLCARARACVACGCAMRVLRLLRVCMCVCVYMCRLCGGWWSGALGAGTPQMHA
jgi:hypothetical protein